MNYTFVGASLGQGESGLTLRVYIDRGTADVVAADQPRAATVSVQLEDGTTNVPLMDKSGILVDDCAAVSRQIGAALDVEDLIAGEYCLEVSSPGVDRPLFSVADFEAQTGNTVKLRLAVASVTGRRNYKGKIVRVEDAQLVVEVDGEQHELSIEDVEFANLVTKV